MSFSVVESGYDQAQVDACLDGLRDQLARTAAQARSAAEVRAELAVARQEIDRLRALLAARPGVSEAAGVQRQAADFLAQAREVLLSAREEARQVRDRAYAEALQSRRDFEAALRARRRREARMDEILRQAGILTEPVDEPAPSAVPATRPADGGVDDPAQGAEQRLPSTAAGAPDRG
jgi:hypothetical protein